MPIRSLCLLKGTAVTPIEGIWWNTTQVLTLGVYQNGGEAPTFGTREKATTIVQTVGCCPSNHGSRCLEGIEGYFLFGEPPCSIGGRANQRETKTNTISGDRFFVCFAQFVESHSRGECKGASSLESCRDPLGRQPPLKIQKPMESCEPQSKPE